MRVTRFIWMILLCGYLGLYQGNLALFLDGQTHPVEIFPRTVQIYPEADRRALSQGIPFSSESEMHRLLEDYLS